VQRSAVFLESRDVTFGIQKIDRNVVTASSFCLRVGTLVFNCEC
jgi:hypothetical protein